MTTQIKRRRGTAAEHTSFTGADAELTVNTTNKSVHVHDGTTVGGHELARADGSNLAVSGNDVTFGDNDKAIFGAGSDLQIYHDGSNSYVDDAGTGGLILRGLGGVTIGKYTGETMAEFEADAAVKLRYNNVNKLATTSTGIDVTGTVTADGLTLSSASSPNLNITDTTNTVTTQIASTDTQGFIGTITNHTFQIVSNGTKRLRIESNGDINLGYEDTGITPKLFWDASAESLGIGTASPDTDLDISSSTGPTVRIQNSSTGLGNGTTVGKLEIYANDSSGNGTGAMGYLETTSTSSFGNNFKTVLGTPLGGGNNVLALANGSEHVFLKSSGNVGIGTSSPSSALHVKGANALIHVQPTGDTQTTGIVFRNAADGVSQAFVAYNHASDYMYFRTNGSGEAMRIDSSGKLIVGHTGAGSSYFNEGIVLNPGGDSVFHRDGNSVVDFSRETSDGNIVRFVKDNSVVGSIGVVNTNNLFIQGDSTETGLQFGTNTIIPHQSGVEVDNTVSLGQSGERFKDLYLSGGVYLGGTGAANYLDDYEEGTFTPTLRGSSTAGTYEASSAQGSYIKVGKLVTVSFVLVLSSSITAGGSGNAIISGFPFNYDGGSGGGFASPGSFGSLRISTVDFDNVAVELILSRNSSSSSNDFVITEAKDNASATLVNIGDVGSSSVFSHTFSYFADS